jgi:hypothetical protein
VEAPDVAEEIDGVVAAPRQVRQLLAAVTSIPPEAASFGCLYYATMRPGEAAALRQRDCMSLPDSG